jgi:hypothetical protein
MTDKVFVEKYICPHKKAALHLAEDCVAAYRGTVPANFIFTWTNNGLWKLAIGDWHNKVFTPSGKLVIPVSVFFA